MDPVLDWYQLIVTPLSVMVRDAIAFIPNIVASLFIVLIGILLAVFMRMIVQVVLKACHFDAFA